MIGRRPLVVIAWASLAACGDDLRRDDTVTAVSGSRLALQWYGYADGTRQPEPDEFYDTLLHARCTPTLWIDEAVRCVPRAEDAVYTDDACTVAVGRAQTLDEPTHFITYDRVGDRVRPARVFTAGDEIEPIATYFQILDGVCDGPFTSPAGITYHATTGEVAGGDLIILRDGELGAGRLGLRIRHTDDGLLVPIGLHDRTLDVDCAPAPEGEGAVACEPIGAAPATHFRDPACSEPVVLVRTIGSALVPAHDDPDPTIAAVADLSGCLRYHAVGGEVVTPLYQRDGEACRPAPVFPPPRVLAVGAPLDLPLLERTREDAAGHRLQHVALVGDDLRVHDTLLFDTATRAECRRALVGDVFRCLPTALATATTLFTASCAVAVPVAELPERACERPAFAAGFTAAGLELRAIGDRAAGTLYQFNGLCSPYTSVPGRVLHTLGPPLDPTTFVGAVYFGER